MERECGRQTKGSSLGAIKWKETSCWGRKTITPSPHVPSNESRIPYKLRPFSKKAHSSVPDSTKYLEGQCFCLFLFFWFLFFLVAPASYKSSRPRIEPMPWQQPEP